MLKDQDARNWLRLSQVIDIIMAAEHCERDTALTLIRAKLGSGTISCCWRLVRLSASIKRIRQPPYLSDEWVPNDPLFWDNVQISPGGLVSVPQKHGGYLVGHPAFYPNFGILTRLVLELAKEKAVDRAKVSELRKQLSKRISRRLYLSKEHILTEWPSSKSSSKPPAAAVSKPQIREVAKRVLRGRPRQPNINEATKLIKGEIPNARRQRIREVLKETEFARMRRKPGRPALSG
jgi:hypothetical protein